MYIQCSDGDDAEGEVDEEEEEEGEQMGMMRRHEDTFTRKLER